MELPKIRYDTPTPTHAKFKSEAPDILRRTGAIIAAGMRDAGRTRAQGLERASAILADGLRRSGQIRGQGIYNNMMAEANLRINRELAEKKLAINDRLIKTNLQIGIVNTLANAAIKVGTTLIAENNQLKAIEAETTYNEKMAMTLSELDKDTVDVDNPLWKDWLKYDPKDVMTVPEVQPNGDVINVNKIATNRVMGQIYERAQKEAMDAALESVGGEIQPKLKSVIRNSHLKTQLAMQKRHNVLQAKENAALYRTLIDKSIRAKDTEKLDYLLEVSTKQGYVTHDEARVFRQEMSDIITIDNINDSVRGLSPTEDNKMPSDAISKLKNTIGDSDLPSAIKERELNQLEAKINEINLQIKEADRLFQEDLVFKMVDDETKALRGNEPINEVQKRIIAKLEKKGYTGLSNEVASRTRQARADLKAVTKAPGENLKRDWWRKARQMEPGGTPPPLPTNHTKDMAKAHNDLKNGIGLQVNQKVYDGLRRMEATQPDQFARLDLEEYSKHLDNKTYNELVDKQNKILKGDWDESKASDYIKFNDQWAAEASEAGVNLKSEDGLLLKSRCAEAIREKEIEQQGKLNPDERRKFIRNFLNEEITTTEKTLLGGTWGLPGFDKTKTVTEPAADSIITKYQRELSNIADGMPGMTRSNEDLLLIYEMIKRKGDGNFETGLARMAQGK